MRTLIDTGVLLRFFDPTDAHYSSIVAYFTKHIGVAAKPVVFLQNIVEFWNVSTRPKSARGGYGQGVETTEQRIRLLEEIIDILPEHPLAATNWRHLVNAYQVMGASVHDARIVANMQAYAITEILTLNPTDFKRYPNIIVKTPDA